MKTQEKSIEDVDSYIAGFPPDTQEQLQHIRNIIKKVAPKAEEVISYQMPAYKLDGMLVYFAGYKGHIGFYPTPSAIKAFKDELSIYKGAKGSVQFPLGEKLPASLITKIVKFRIAENKAAALIKAESKKIKKSSK